MQLIYIQAFQYSHKVELQVREIATSPTVSWEWEDVIDTYKSPRCWREEDEARDGYGNVPRRDDRRTVVWRHLPYTDARWSWYRIHGPLPQDSGLYPASTSALPRKKKRIQRRPPLIGDP